MKIVLAGTGFIGTEILQQCIDMHYIHHIYVLTRKPLDTKYSTHKKVTEVQHENFDELPDHLFARLKGWDVSGCIWALGPRSQLKNVDETQKVGVKYPTQAAEQFAKLIAPGVVEKQNTKVIKPFRFVFISGWGAEQDQFRSLWLWSEWRKMKGTAEKCLFEVAATSQEVKGKKCFEVVALRPGAAIAAGDALTSAIAMGTTPSVTVDRIARQAIRVVLDGDAEGRTILENKDLLGDDWAQINTFTM